MPEKKCVRLPMEPLINIVNAHGGITDMVKAIGLIPHERRYDRLTKMYDHARRRGKITIENADELCIEVLKAHPLSVWGEAWWTGLPDEELADAS